MFKFKFQRLQNTSALCTFFVHFVVKYIFKLTNE